MTETLRYCSDCGRLHRTETITHDTDGWPDTFRWLEPHDPAAPLSPRF